MIKFKALKRFKSWMKYDPPGAMSSKGWRLFEEEYKERAPIRYWFCHDLKYSTVMPIKWKFDKIYDWIRYRTYDRYHIVDTGLIPLYYDASTQILNVNFNILKEFVEVDQAWHAYRWSDGSKKASWCEKHMPFYHRIFPLHDLKKYGIEHLEWASTLDDPALAPHQRSDQQAVSAREILALYKWWTEERTARKEIEYSPYDRQGLGALASFDDDFDRDTPDFKAHVESMDASIEQEKGWETEDEEMLVRLMRVRTFLWT